MKSKGRIRHFTLFVLFCSFAFAMAISAYAQDEDQHAEITGYREYSTEDGLFRVLLPEDYTMSEGGLTFSNKPMTGIIGIKEDKLNSSFFDIEVIQQADGTTVNSAFESAYKQMLDKLFETVFAPVDENNLYDMEKLSVFGWPAMKASARSADDVVSWIALACYQQGYFFIVEYIRFNCAFDIANEEFNRIIEPIQEFSSTGTSWDSPVAEYITKDGVFTIGVPIENYTVNYGGNGLFTIITHEDNTTQHGVIIVFEQDMSLFAKALRKADEIDRTVPRYHERYVIEKGFCDTFEDGLIEGMFDRETIQASGEENVETGEGYAKHFWFTSDSFAGLTRSSETKTKVWVHGVSCFRNNKSAVVLYLKSSTTLDLALIEFNSIIKPLFDNRVVLTAYETGYDANDNNEDNEDDEEKQVSPFPCIGIPTSNGINIRKTPSKDGSRVGRASKSDRLTVLNAIKENGTTWYEVKLEDGSSGYVSSKLLVLQDENGNTVTIDGIALPRKSSSQSAIPVTRGSTKGMKKLKMYTLKKTAKENDVRSYVFGKPSSAYVGASARNTASSLFMIRVVLDLCQTTESKSFNMEVLCSYPSYLGYYRGKQDTVVAALQWSDTDWYIVYYIPSKKTCYYKAIQGLDDKKAIEWLDDNCDEYMRVNNGWLTLNCNML